MIQVQMNPIYQRRNRMTEENKKDEDNWVSDMVEYTMAKGEAVGIPTFVFLKQHIEKIKREATIIEAFLEKHIKDLRDKNDRLDAERKKEKEEKVNNVE